VRREVTYLFRRYGINTATLATKPTATATAAATAAADERLPGRHLRRLLLVLQLSLMLFPQALDFFVFNFLLGICVFRLIVQYLFEKKK
jgi:hypothetical protein